MDRTPSVAAGLHPQLTWSSTHRSALIVLVFMATYVAAIAGAPPESLGSTLIPELAELAAPLLAATLCWTLSRRHNGRPRNGWLFMSAACMASAGGQAASMYHEIVLEVEMVMPSVADLGNLAFVPLAATSLALLDRDPGRKIHVRSLLDWLTIGAALLFLSWTTLIVPLARASSSDVLTKATALAYPVTDMFIAALVLFLLASARGRDRSIFLLLGAGLTAMAVADTVLLYLLLHDLYAPGSVAGVGTFGGFLLIGMAAIASVRAPAAMVPKPRRQARVMPRIQPYLPYLAVISAIALAGYMWITEGTLDAVLFWNLLVIFALVASRQLTTLLDNVRLNRDLEKKVEERSEQLNRSEQRFRSLVQNSSDVTMVIDREGRISYVSPSITHELGFSPEALTGGDGLELVPLEEAQRVGAVYDEVAAQTGAFRTVELQATHADGTIRWVEAKLVNRLDDPSVQGIVANWRDVTERKRLESELQRQAFEDSLTGLANRALFTDRVQHALQRAGRNMDSLAVLFVDLDDFKTVNDSLGHEAGDRLLLMVADRLRGCLRSIDTAARLGGDEFAVLIEDVQIADAAADVARRITESLREPFCVDAREVFVRASIGIAECRGEWDVDEFLRNADVAMYTAKRHGKGRFELFEPSMHTAVMERLDLKAALERAVERGEFVVHYQPTVDLMSGRMSGVEALVRWQHPERGLLPPDVFVPLAEETGIILQLGRHVLEVACRQMVKWHAQQSFRPLLTLNVNLSPRQLLHEDLVPDVRAVLEATGIDPRTLTLELTESALNADADSAVRQLEALKTLGLRLAIDDFGTGYSSLQHLKRFPVDIIKIDKSFIRSMEDGEEAATIASAVVKLGHNLNLMAVAEGIESMDQLARLQALGCQMGQGYYFSEPVGGYEIDRLIAQVPDGALQPPLPSVLT